METLAIGTVIRGKLGFRLERVLGDGAFGAVYEAAVIDHVPGGEAPERVAVKVLHSAMADNHRRHALQRELSAMLAIDDQRIPRVFDWVIDGDVPFIAMEYFPNGSLADRLDESGQMQEAEVLTLLEHLLEALLAAHSASVLHLDIKPANVLVDSGGGYVLTDFGIAQAPRSGKKMAMAGFGSVGWQAPEQEQGLRGTFDLRTDLFGVGVTCWSALTGIDLGSADGLELRSGYSRGTAALPRVTSLRACDRDLSKVVMSMLSRTPQGRPGDANIALAEVRRLRRGGVKEQLPGRPIRHDDLRELLSKVMDPLVVQLFRKDHRGIRYLQRDEILCDQGDTSVHAFVLIHGSLDVYIDETFVATINREGEFMGEIAALTGQARTATLIANGEVWVRILDAAQLESVIATNPSLGVRLIRTMANRFVRLG